MSQLRKAAAYTNRRSSDTDVISYSTVCFASRRPMHHPSSRITSRRQTSLTSTQRNATQRNSTQLFPLHDCESLTVMRLGFGRFDHDLLALFVHRRPPLSPSLSPHASPVRYIQPSPQPRRPRPAAILQRAKQRRLHSP